MSAIAPIISFLFYLGFGVAMHAFMLGATIDPASAWSIGWIVGWPILLIALGFKWFLILAAAIAATVGVWMLWDNVWFRAYRKLAEASRRRA